MRLLSHGLRDENAGQEWAPLDQKQRSMAPAGIISGSPRHVAGNRLAQDRTNIHRDLRSRRLVSRKVSIRLMVKGTIKCNLPWAGNQCCRCAAFLFAGLMALNASVECLQVGRGETCGHETRCRPNGSDVKLRGQGP